MQTPPLISLLNTLPPLALGTSAFGGTHWGQQDDKDSMAAFEQAVESGVRHIDTAAVYGRGRSETLIGRILRSRPALRDSLLIASKGGIKGNAVNFLREIEKSRRRLACEQLDLYYIHWPSSSIDPRPSLDALARARDAGIIRYAGVSNFNSELTAAAHAHIGIDAVQFGYNLIWRSPERRLIPYCSQNCIATVAYGSLAQGLLSGRIGPETRFPEGDDRMNTRFYQAGTKDKVFHLIAAMKALLQQEGVSLLDAVRAWSLRRGLADQYLLGARNAAQAAEDFSPVEVSDNLVSRLDELGNETAEYFMSEDNFFGFRW